ncbi:hypothetical protein [Escherichia phage EK010]|uniref:Uncharacterized protein n=1 Tax=Escherichia phage EK010 TaxID=2742112 RepID=A0A6J4EH38_9CAUD|nr:hypothetical protein PQC42_gp114 [Escherichia phage EK010]BCG44949.1 hypothetical protein [Escherichia phage EK010]
MKQSPSRKALRGIAFLLAGLLTFILPPLVMDQFMRELSEECFHK